MAVKWDIGQPCTWYDVQQDLPASAEVVVIGGGVIGSAIARELTKYTPDVVIIEKENDVADGTSKANNAMVHSGMGEEFGKLKQQLNVKGNAMYDDFVRGLNVEFWRNGMLVLFTPRSFSDEIAASMTPEQIHQALAVDIPTLLVKDGVKKGIPGQRLVQREELFQLEPHVNPDTLVAMLDPTYGIVNPYKLTIALAENAVMNGARVVLNTQVTDILLENGSVSAVVTDRGTIKARYVVNAAGLFADKVARMVGDDSFKIHPRKGATLLFDKDLVGGLVRHSIAMARVPPDKHTKGGGVFPTVDGNIQFGATAAEVDDKYDTSVTAEEIERMFDRYPYMVPDFPTSAVISAFTGVRAPTAEEDFVIGPVEGAFGFVNAAGMQSPALASSPAIAEMVVGILHEMGVTSERRESWSGERPVCPIFSRLTSKDRESLIKGDERWGHVVCRCETVTEAEVANAIHGIIPATTMDAIKRRTRVGMGRCQGGFCGPRVAAILARELSIPVNEVTKDGEGSELFCCDSKDLLREMG